MPSQQKAPARAGAESEPMGPDTILRGELTLLGFLFFALGNQGHTLLLGELDLKLITRDQIQQSCVGLANQQVAVALHNSLVGELAAAFANTAARANANAFGFEQCLIKSGEVEPVRPCLLYTSPSPRDATLSRMPSSA